jgi:hypothetical protein
VGGPDGTAASTTDFGLSRGSTVRRSRGVHIPGLACRGGTAKRAQLDGLEDQIGAWFARSRVTRPGSYRLDRLVAAARLAHDERAFRAVAAHLDAETRCRLDGLLADDGSGAAFSRLQADPGRVGLESLLAEIDKLDIVRSLRLPPDILKPNHPALIKRFRRRVATEAVWELRRHPERIRLPLLVFYCVPREAEIIDGLVELLLEITHRITVRAERRVVEELLEEYRQVGGKTGILFRVAEAAVGNPNGIVREVIFPVVGEGTFEALVREHQASGNPQNRRIHTAIRASYGSYYRRMLPKILAALEFRSNNAMHRPLLEAIEAIWRHQGDSRQYFALSEIPVDDVIRPKWRDIVIEDALGGGKRVNRINYEICVLQTLRDKLRCKEVWVVGANRFRNPDDDLPADFVARREACYQRLALPQDGQAFIGTLKSEMTEALTRLDRRLPRNGTVRIDPRRRHPIVVSPLDAQPEPSNLEALNRTLPSFERKPLIYFTGDGAGLSTRWA